MRKKSFILLILLSFLAVGLIAGCGANNVPPSSAEVDSPSSPEVVPPGPTAPGNTIGFLVKKVDAMPQIDGDAGDPQWKDAIGVVSSNTTLKGVYTDDEVAFLYIVEDPTMSVVTPDSWYYDGEKFVRWRAYREEQGDPVYRSWEMYNMAWETSDFALDEGGCNFMCHTDDAGKNRHVVPPGAGADLWNILCKHGYGPGSMHETGFPLGYLGASQEGKISFVQNDTKDPYQVTSGTFTFVGWADERIQTSFDNPDYAGTAGSTETGKYCLQCYGKEWAEGNSLQGKEGKMPYRRNAVGFEGMYATAPEYIKLNPKDFADGIMITDKDIKEGRAVKIASLSKAEIEKAWARYEELHCMIPELILQEPSGNRARTLIGAKWSDGVWTVEIKRARVTNNPHDIQFDDINKKYALSTAVSFGVEGKRASGGFGSDTGINVIFEKPTN